MEPSRSTIESQTGETCRDLPGHGWPRVRMLLARAVKRRCPLCGSPGIFKTYMTIKDSCPRCGYEFAREGGYFLGGYALNLLAAEFIPVGLMIALFIWSDLSWIVLEAVLIPLALGLPLLFFPFARTFWMALDLTLTPVNQR